MLPQQRVHDLLLQVGPQLPGLDLAVGDHLCRGKRLKTSAPSRRLLLDKNGIPRIYPAALTDHLWQRGGLQVQHDGALLDARFQLHQAVQGERGHVGLAPALAALLHLLLKLDPSGRQTKKEKWDE